MTISLEIAFEPMFRSFRAAHERLERQAFVGYKPVLRNNLISSLCVPEFHRVPIKKHNRRKPRHELIQKKWVKRYGTKLERVFYLTQHGDIIAHTSSIAWLEAQIETRLPWEIKL